MALEDHIVALPRELRFEIYKACARLHATAVCALITALGVPIPTLPEHLRVTQKNVHGFITVVCDDGRVFRLQYLRWHGGRDKCVHELRTSLRYVECHTKDGWDRCTYKEMGGPCTFIGTVVDASYRPRVRFALVNRGTEGLVEAQDRMLDDLRVELRARYAVAAKTLTCCHGASL